MAQILLMGTGGFSLPPFQALLESDHDIRAVYTQPERIGRGHHRHFNPVKFLAEENNIPVRQPKRVNEPEVLDQLRSFDADLFIVAAYGQLLKPELLAIPRLGAFNLHASLLPRHRGAAPVQYSIWKGDRETGVTIFEIQPALDSGPIAGCVKTRIGPKETSGELMQRLANLSVPLTLDVVNQLEAGRAVLKSQDERLATLAPKIRKEEGTIDWSRSAEEITCHVRAMQPWPKAGSCLRSRGTSLRCLLHEVTPVDGDAKGTAEPGMILDSGKRLIAATGSGPLEIVRIQPPGKSVMPAAAFLNGCQISEGSRFAD